MADLLNRRWALPILAELYASSGRRFVPLANRLGLSRDALRETLAELVGAGLVERNPGYGHPLRPEYVLTEHGRRVANEAAALLAELRRVGVEDVGLRKWSLPVLAELDGERRYGELRRAVGATPRALTLALKELLEARLVERRVLDRFPPATSYRASPAGRKLGGLSRRLAAAL